MAALDICFALVGNQSPANDFGMGLYLGLPFFLLWLSLLVWSIILAIRLLAQERWLIGLTSPVIPVLTFLASWWVMPYVEYPQDYEHFRAMRPSYDAAIATLPKDGHRYDEFNWGGMLFASKGVVYDETDEVGLPFGRQSARWKKRMRPTDLTCGGEGPIGEVMPLGGHYYVVSFGC